MNSTNESLKEGRDSWLVKRVFGKMEAAVDCAKSRRQTEEVLPDLETVFCGSVILNKGVGQQLWRHTCEASFSLGECIHQG